MAGLCPTSAQQTTQTTAGLSPWSQPYVSSMLGAAQQQVFNTNPSTGQITGIQPYQAFGSPVTPQGQPAPMSPFGANLPMAPPGIAQEDPNFYRQFAQQQQQAQQQQDMQGFPQIPQKTRPPLSYENFVQSFSREPGDRVLTQEDYQKYLAQRQPQQTLYEQPKPQFGGYPQGTMQAGMGPGEMLAAQSAVAAPTALQQQAYGSAAGMQTPGQFGTATDIGTTAGLGLLGTAGQAQGLQNLGMQAVQQGQQYAQDITNPFRTAQFMSPYMQNVVDVQQQQARRQAEIAAQTQQAQAAQRGAFGGSRDAIQRAQAAAELQRNLQGIQATGLQTAFQNAQAQQQEAQRQAMAGYQTGIQGYGQGITGQTGAYGQAAQTAAGLGTLGGQQLGAQQSIAGLQNTLGQQQQANQQAIINQAMQNFQLQKMYPQQQLQYLSGLLSGLPVSSTGQVSTIPGPNMLSQLAGLGTTAVGAAGLYKGITGQGIGTMFGFKDGGSVASGVGIDELAMRHALAGD